MRFTYWGCGGRKLGYYSPGSDHVNLPTYALDVAETQRGVNLVPHLNIDNIFSL